MDTTPNDPWPWRLRTMLISGFGIAVLVAWASISYFGRDPGFVESFNPNDGWCDPAAEGLGIHCFGDFQFPRVLLGEPSIWGTSIPHPYTPTGMLPHVVANGLADIGLGVRGSLIVFLIWSAAALLAPALWVVLGSGRRPRDVLPLVLVGLASGPFLMTLDRGSSIGFAVPFLLLFCLFVREEPAWVSVVSVIGAASIRPQFVLLAVALRAFGRLKAMSAAVLGSIGVALLGFAVWPGGFLDNIREWARDVSAFQDGVDIAASTPANISAAHSVASLGGWLSALPGPVGTAGDAIVSFADGHADVLGVVLVLLVVAVFFIGRGRLSPALVLVIALALPALVQVAAYGYSLVFALVLAALILGPARPDYLMGRPVVTRGLFSGQADSSSPVSWWKWLVLVVTTLSIVPVIVSTGSQGQSLVKENIGIAWLAVILTSLALAVVALVRGRRPDGRPSISSIPRG